MAKNTKKKEYKKIHITKYLKIFELTLFANFKSEEIIARH
jgi:hypothetical protein